MSLGEKKDFAVPVSSYLLIPGKPTDIGHITAQDFGYFVRIVKTILKLNHWIPKTDFIRFLVSNWSLFILPWVRSDAHPFVLLTNIAISDWLNPADAHQDMNCLISCWSEFSVS